jgi:hypothetical protein
MCVPASSGTSVPRTTRESFYASRLYNKRAGRKGRFGGGFGLGMWRECGRNCRANPTSGGPAVRRSGGLAVWRSGVPAFRRADVRGSDVGHQKSDGHRSQMPDGCRRSEVMVRRRDRALLGLRASGFGLRASGLGRRASGVGRRAPGVRPPPRSGRVRLRDSRRGGSGVRGGRDLSGAPRPPTSDNRPASDLDARPTGRPGEARRLVRYQTSELRPPSSDLRVRPPPRSGRGQPRTPRRGGSGVRGGRDRSGAPRPPTSGNRPASDLDARPTGRPGEARRPVRYQTSELRHPTSDPFSARTPAVLPATSRARASPAPSIPVLA